MAAEVSSLATKGIDAIVVTQGTDTIEETTFVLGLLINTEALVVVTGAMRNPRLSVLPDSIRVDSD